MNNSCNICNAVQDEEPLNTFDENEIESFITRVFFGLVTLSALDVNVYRKTTAKLMEAVFKGYGKDFASLNFEFGHPDYKMLASLRENVYVFSAAKNYQQTKELSRLLINKNGEAISFHEFKKEARKVFDRYNKHYLKVEYNSAISQARSASIWQQIEANKELYGLLEYHTINDKRVRPEHQILHGIIKPVNDPWWSTYFPPNGWQCRCSVLQLDKGKITPDAKLPVINEKQVPELFRFNPGQSKIIFSPKHPYFEVAKQDKELARQNFNLPTNV